MELNIDDIFEYLSWDNSDDIQRLGIDSARRIKNLSVLIMPVETKSIWENCAKVLCEKNDKELEIYYYELFKWFQDMNWPGADLIYDRFLFVTQGDLLAAFQHSFSEAIQLEDKAWISALRDVFKEFMLRHPDRDFPSTLRSIL